MGTTRLQSRELSTPLPLVAILLAIAINRKLITINAKSMDIILNLFIKTGNHRDTILWSIKATLTSGCDLISYWYQSEARNYQWEIKGHKYPQPVYQNSERLLSRSKQYGVSISRNVFEVNVLQVKVNRLNYNS